MARHQLAQVNVYADVFCRELEAAHGTLLLKVV